MGCGWRAWHASWRWWDGRRAWLVMQALERKDAELACLSFAMKCALACFIAGFGAQGKLACRLHGPTMPLTAGGHEHDGLPCHCFPLQRSYSMTPSSSHLPSTTSLSSSSSSIRPSSIRPSSIRPSSSSPRRVLSPASHRRRPCRRRHGSPSSATTAQAPRVAASPLQRSCLQPWAPCHWAARSRSRLAGRPGAQEAGRQAAAAATRKGRARPCWCTW